jgi:hypothetical protein
MATETHEGSELADALLQRIGQTIGERIKVLDRLRGACGTRGITVIPVAQGAVRVRAAAAVECGKAMKGRVAAAVVAAPW